VLTALLCEGCVDQDRLPWPFLFTLIKGDRLCLSEEELVKVPVQVPKSSLPVGYHQIELFDLKS